LRHSVAEEAEHVLPEEERGEPLGRRYEEAKHVLPEKSEESRLGVTIWCNLQCQVHFSRSLWELEGPSVRPG